MATIFGGGVQKVRIAFRKPTVSFDLEETRGARNWKRFLKCSLELLIPWLFFLLLLLFNGRGVVIPSGWRCLLFVFSWGEGGNLTCWEDQRHLPSECWPSKWSGTFAQTPGGTYPLQLHQAPSFLGQNAWYVDVESTVWTPLRGWGAVPPPLTDRPLVP